MFVSVCVCGIKGYTPQIFKEVRKDIKKMNEYHIGRNGHNNYTMKDVKIQEQSDHHKR